MTPQELRAHKLADKLLKAVPNFRLLKKGKLPRPFYRMGGSKITSTGMVSVGQNYEVMLLVRSGQNLEDTHFFGYLMRNLGGGNLSPIFEFHWHPSHKGFHCKMPCRTTTDYTNRILPGAPELNIKTQLFDPRIEVDRAKLIHVFCDACGITLGSDNGFGQMDIWNSPPA